MNPADPILLSRDCRATVVPAGDAVTLPMGTSVKITHRLGGHFTVVCDYGMFRIHGSDADAIGETVPKPETILPQGPTDGPPQEAALWDALKGVFDPEIPVNIVDLGLVYSLAVTEAPEKQYIIDMAMTLTAPGCGMGPSIAADATDRLKSVPGVADARVELVWEPPWTQDMISEEGKMELGLI
jgi:probable FeS assembly SUF system protein SufT